MCGCSNTQRRALDALLAADRIDRIEIVDLERNRTRILTADALVQMTGHLASSNRVSAALRNKSTVGGYVALSSQGRRVAVMDYFPSRAGFVV